MRHPIKKRIPYPVPEEEKKLSSREIQHNTLQPHKHSYSNLLDVATGVWWMLETNAYHANTPAKAACFRWQVGNVAKYFVCKECREHFQTFLSEHPLEKYITDLDGNFISQGCYIWVNEAHNNANILTGKVIVPLHEGMEFQRKQSEGEGCDNCTFSP